ncbi:MAG TPA: hypothetical protein DC001_02005 [Clostridiales bacterium]|jgi:hypothetical protein|nr:hypothetical protein [Clostridiales bacterium]HBR08773.1 hypothetical protein [Clostridiales bacterium]
MSEYDNFKESLKSTFYGVADMAKNLVSTAGDKAKSLTRIAKLTMDINAEKENTKKVFAEIGKLYYETNLGSPGDFFVQLFDEVSLANDQIMSMEAELAALKSSLSDSGVCDFEDVVMSDESAADMADDGIQVEIVEAAPEAPVEAAAADDLPPAEVPPAGDLPQE